MSRGGLYYDLMTEQTNEELGRQVVVRGDLAKIRKRLGLSRRAMSEILHTTPSKYNAWESNPNVRLWSITAERIGAFYRAAEKELEILSGEGVSLRNMLPFHVAATELGLPQELLMKKYRDGEFVGHDLGVLGLWIDKTELPKIS